MSFEWRCIVNEHMWMSNFMVFLSNISLPIAALGIQSGNQHSRSQKLQSSCSYAVWVFIPVQLRYLFSISRHRIQAICSLSRIIASLPLVLFDLNQLFLINQFCLSLLLQTLWPLASPSRLQSGLNKTFFLPILLRYLAINSCSEQPSHLD